MALQPPSSWSSKVRPVYLSVNVMASSVFFDVGAVALVCCTDVPCLVSRKIMRVSWPAAPNSTALRLGSYPTVGSPPVATPLAPLLTVKVLNAAGAVATRVAPSADNGAAAARTRLVARAARRAREDGIPEASTPRGGLLPG